MNFSRPAVDRIPRRSDLQWTTGVATGWLQKLYASGDFADSSNFAIS
jgi:hypothetical protein